jgi:hypothetical protein
VAGLEDRSLSNGRVSVPVVGRGGRADVGPSGERRARRMTLSEDELHHDP